MAYIITEKETGKVVYITDAAPTETLSDYKVFQHASLKPGDEIGYEVRVTFDKSGNFQHMSTVKIGVAQQEINKRIAEVKEQQALIQTALDDLIFGGGM